MTCTECKYQWCWLCEGQYEYGHYGDDGPCKGLQFKKINYLSELTKNEQARLGRRGPVKNNENLERYIGPDNDKLKTTLRGTLLYVIDNSNQNEGNRNLKQVKYESLFEIDDDLKVPFDDYYNDLYAPANVYVFPRCWHYFWGVLTPTMYIYAMNYGDSVRHIEGRCVRFILNLIGFICSLIFTMCYFFYALVICNIIHIIFFCVQEFSIFTYINTSIKVGCKDMRRIRRYSRFKYVRGNRNNIYW